MSSRPSLFRSKDISRAFKAARAAGVTARVDIAPDGTIRIFPAPLEAVALDLKPNDDAQPGAPGLRNWD
ncbi:MAG: hypothetical protein WBE80_15115 [Methylocella sp.]